MVVSAAIISGVATAAGVTREIAKQSSLESQARFQYDFPGLLIKLAVFFLVALAISKIFEAIIFISSPIRIALRTIGINLPDSLPENVVNFFSDGVKIGDIQLKFWDIVKIIATLFVILEWFSWYQKSIQIAPNVKGLNQPFTHGIFGIIVAGLLLTTIPELWSRLKEIKAMNQTIGSPQGGQTRSQSGNKTQGFKSGVDF